MKLDKLEVITGSGEILMGRITGLVALTPQEALQGMRQVMDPRELQMFDLALFCEQEAIKAQNANAHFAACLMGAAMNEAILAFMCLRFEADVRTTKQYGHSTKKGEREFKAVVGDCKLEQFIVVAEQLEWIATAIVEASYVEVLAEDFRELMPITHPEMTQQDIDLGASSFYQSPGPAMLRMTQHLRNAIHPGKWLKGTAGFVPERFTPWCQVATRLCGEIRLCLLHRITESEGEKALIKMQQAEEMIAKLPVEYRTLLETQFRSRLGL